jgi:hypothetical protein
VEPVHLAARPGHDPVTLLGGPLAAYNVLFVLGLATGRVCAFPLLRRFTSSRAAAGLGALLFGFSPAVIAAGLGHQPGADRRRRSPRRCARASGGTCRTGAHAIVVGPDARAALAGFVQRLVRRPPLRTGGVLLWRHLP